MKIRKWWVLWERNFSLVWCSSRHVSSARLVPLFHAFVYTIWDSFLFAVALAFRVISNWRSKPHAWIVVAIYGRPWHNIARDNNFFFSSERKNFVPRSVLHDPFLWLNMTSKSVRENLWLLCFKSLLRLLNVSRTLKLLLEWYNY